MAGGYGDVHGATGYDDFEYGGADDCQGAGGCVAEYEVGADELHAEPGGVYSGERVDRGSVWNPAGFLTAIGLFTFGSLLCGLAGNMHMLVASRIVQGCGGALMVPVGRIALVRTFPKSQLLRAYSFVTIPALIGPFLGPLVGGFIVDNMNWRVIFFVNLPMGLFGIWLAHWHMPDYRRGRSIRWILWGWCCSVRGSRCFRMCWRYLGSRC